MTEFYYKNRNYKIDHRTFGGIIFPSDFNTEMEENIIPKGLQLPLVLYQIGILTNIVKEI